MKKITLIITIVVAVILILSYSSLTLKIEDENDKMNNSINEKIFSDKDNDTISDEEDDFPDDPAASLDTDKDGYPDRWNEGKKIGDSTSNLILDKFPYDLSASVDNDDDGYPDYWNQGKNQDDSTSIPPLELDEFPNDSNAHKDTDKDGYADFYDKNDNVNLSITLEIIKFKLTKNVDILPWGQIYLKASVGEKKEEIKESVFGLWTWLNKIVYINHKIEYDIPDNTDQDYTKIKISMYDFDFLKDDDEVDINENKNNKSIFLKFDNKENKIDYKNIEYGSQATIWYEIHYPDSDNSKEDYHLTYNWWYKKKGYSMNQFIDEKIYLNYLESDINRAPQSSFDSSAAMKKFVTSNEEVIIDISNKLKKISEEENFNDLEEVNFILKFVQIIDYAYDNKTKGSVEYWKFPVETLVEKKGDCEDTSVLYASILDVLGYDTVLLYYSWVQDDKIVGHISVGLNLDSAKGEYILDRNGVKYYYCETTNKFDVGKIPDTPSYLKEDPYKIIYI